MTATPAPQPLNKLAGTLRHRLLLSIEQFRVLDKVMLAKALTLAEETHARETRRPTKDSQNQGAPYIVHPMRVALIITEELELREPIAVAAALLHDTVESSKGKVSIALIEEMFGRPIAMMVAILTKPAMHNASQAEKEQKLKIYHERIVQASVETKLVKLADRLDNVRDAANILDKGFQLRYLEQTRDFYLPIADNCDSYLYDELAIACEKLEHELKYR